MGEILGHRDEIFVFESLVLFSEPHEISVAGRMQQGGHFYKHDKAAIELAIGELSIDGTAYRRSHGISSIFCTFGPAGVFGLGVLPWLFRP